MNRPIRGLVAKIGLNGRNSGAKVIATALPYAGMGVMNIACIKPRRLLFHPFLPDSIA